MKIKSLLVLLFGVSVACFNGNVCADVVLTFDQLGIANSVLIDQAYGDRVSTSPDGNGHSYGFVGSTLTPGIMVTYGGGGIAQPALWTTGYGNLTNVFYNETDNDDALTILFDADSGYEVGLFNFDMAAFGSADQVIPGIEIRNQLGAVLWSAGPTSIDGTTRTNFDIVGGVFGSQLIIDIDLTGLGGASDNIGIDNVQFSQRAVPEPSIWAFGMLAMMGFCTRRKRNFQAAV